MRKRASALAGVLGACAISQAQGQSTCPDPAWWPMGTGMNQTVRAIAVMPNGFDVVAGGDFTMAGEVAVNFVARSLSATGTWAPLGLGTDGTVRALEVLAGGDVIAGGDFSSAGGIPANHVARWSQASGAWAAIGSGVGGIASPAVFALTKTPSGDVIVGGHFITAGGLPASRVARFDPTTGLWSKMGTGIGGAVSPPLAVYTLMALPNGDVVAGGNFNKAGGIPVKGIALWKSSKQSWEEMGPGIFGIVRALTVTPNDEVVVGGGFIKAGEYPTNCVARWDKFGWGWQPLGSGMVYAQNVFPVVNAILSLPSGDIVAGGHFMNAGGKSLYSLAKWTTATNEWDVVSATDWDFSIVHSIKRLANGDVVVGGSFKNYPMDRIVRFGCDPVSCMADCDASGSLTIDDFICFQVSFSMSSYKADCDGDFVLSVDDFLCFQTLFAVGC